MHRPKGESGGLDGHDFLVLGSQDFLDALHLFVVNFLEVGFCVFFYVFRKSVLDGLFEFFDTVAACVSDSHLGFFSLFGALLGELLASFLGERRNAQADYFAVVFGHDADGRVDDGFFDNTEHLLVPRFDGDGACVGGGNGTLGFSISGFFTSSYFT